VPGLKYSVIVVRGNFLVGRVCTDLVLKAGQKKDVGVVRLAAEE
jgi:hypothetical protein